MKHISDDPEALKISTLQVVFDMLMVHENDLLGKDVRHLTIYTPCLLVIPIQNPNIANDLTARLIEETSEKVQALLCIGISKLVLSGMITNPKVGLLALRPCGQFQTLNSLPHDIGGSEPDRGISFSKHCR